MCQCCHVAYLKLYGHLAIFECYTDCYLFKPVLTKSKQNQLYLVKLLIFYYFSKCSLWILPFFCSSIDLSFFETAYGQISPFIFLKLATLVCLCLRVHVFVGERECVCVCDCEWEDLGQHLKWLFSFHLALQISLSFEWTYIFISLIWFYNYIILNTNIFIFKTSFTSIDNRSIIARLFKSLTYKTILNKDPLTTDILNIH